DPDTQLLFVDLFLGTQQDEEARNRALRLVKDIVEPRPESPPMLVLISSSTRLTEMRDEFRDEAGLIGCQFRTMQKTELDDATALHEILYRLITSYRQSLKLSGFLALWRQALNDATIRFFKRVRRLDLRDYADLQTLVLNAEGELVGAYLLEVFGQYFQFELEEDTRLSSSAVDLNQLRWDNYAPPHFLPASDSASIADGMLFRSSKIFAKTDPLQFGDVLFSTRVDALGAEEEPIADFGKGERIALLALTAACDLQHENATRFLFIAGVAKPSELILHKRPTPQLTPILIVDGKHYVVQWEIGAPVAMSENDFKDKIDSGVFIRVRRFRPLFSLQLQQLFTSSLSRVGTMVMPPAQHLAGVVISYRDQNRILRQLISLQPIDGKAVILVGRGVKDFIDKLILGPEVVSELRIAVNKVDVNTLNQNERQKWQSAVHTRELYSKMEEGIPFSREGLKAPFTGTTYDIVTVIGPYVKESPINADRVISGNANLLVIELKVSDQS
ncbi:MAG TPA: hypothetical protein VFC63_21815, partial [Blastocatellia bacterium]|nr:hypothetical protein [Blastocatellia bacterium]